MANSSRDGNFITSILGVSSSDGTTVVPIYADPVSHRLLVNSSATNPVADGTYTVGIGNTTNGTITITNGVITAIQQAS